MERGNVREIVSGMTLIEIIVALTLGSLIMMAITAMYNSSTKMLYSSVRGYRNQVEVSLAVENMARRLENAVWVQVQDNDSDTYNEIYAVLETDDAGNPKGDEDGIKDANDRYHKYFYYRDLIATPPIKELRHQLCKTDFSPCGCNADLSTCDGRYEVLAQDIEDINFTQLGADSQSATKKNVIEVRFRSGAVGDSRSSEQVTRINLRGRGSYGYYD